MKKVKTIECSEGEVQCESFELKCCSKGLVCCDGVCCKNGCLEIKCAPAST